MDITANTDATPEDLHEHDEDHWLFQLIDTAEAARVAGVSEATIRGWAHKKRIVAAGHVGRSPRYLRRDVARVERETRLTGKAPLRDDDMIAGRQILDRQRRQAARTDAA